MRKSSQSSQHFKAGIARLDGDNSSFWLGLGRYLGNVMDALLYCFFFSGGGALNYKTSLAFEPRHLLTDRTETHRRRSICASLKV